MFIHSWQFGDFLLDFLNYSRKNMFARVVGVTISLLICCAWCPEYCSAWGDQKVVSSNGEKIIIDINEFSKAYRENYPRLTRYLDNSKLVFHVNDRGTDVSGKKTIIDIYNEYSFNFKSEKSVLVTNKYVNNKNYDLNKLRQSQVFCNTSYDQFYLQKKTYKGAYLLMERGGDAKETVEFQINDFSDTTHAAAYASTLGTVLSILDKSNVNQYYIKNVYKMLSGDHKDNVALEGVF